MKTKCELKLTSLRESMKDIEGKIFEIKDKWKSKVENKVLEEIKENPAVFYTYARSKAVIKSSVGPFLRDNKYITDEMEMATMLKEQYSSVCSSLREDIYCDAFKTKLFDDSLCSGPRLENIAVSKENVRLHLSKLKNNAAFGPDGVPPIILKRGGNFIEDALCDIALSSMEEEHIPEILKWGWITPIWKGSDPEEPVSYRPISLTSHIGKLVEKLVRE